MMLNKCIFQDILLFLETFVNEKKKRNQKKRKRPVTVRNFGNEKVVSTISAPKYVDKISGSRTLVCLCKKNI